MRNTAFPWVLSGLVVACAADSSDDGASTSGGAVDTSAGASESSADSSDSSSGAAAATGTVTLRFGVSNGVRMGPTLVDPLVGTVYGDLFLTSDVTITGPVEGAVSYASIALEGVDLTTEETATLTWTSEALPAENYTFLGMFDLDANFEASDQNPDAGDPVTLPNQKFDLVADQETAFTVMFELVYG
jgi:hypothetical protein